MVFSSEDWKEGNVLENIMNTRNGSASPETGLAHQPESSRKILASLSFGLNHI